MRESFSLTWLAIVGAFRSRASLEAEIIVLRHQLNVLRRNSRKRPTFGLLDRSPVPNDNRTIVRANEATAPAETAAHETPETEGSTTPAAGSVKVALSSRNDRLENERMDKKFRCLGRLHRIAAGEGDMDDAWGHDSPIIAPNHGGVKPPTLMGKRGASAHTRSLSALGPEEV
jgi:hypothetical protein